MENAPQWSQSAGALQDASVSDLRNLWLAIGPLVRAMLNGPSRSTGSGLSVTPQLYRQCPGVASSAARLSDRSASRTVFFFSWLLTELAEQRIPPRAGRSNPGVVKKPRAKFPARKPSHPGSGTVRPQLNFSVLIPT